MIEIIDKQSKTIHKSKNLRGLIDHFRRVEVEYYAAFNLNENQGGLVVHFVNGDKCCV